MASDPAPLYREPSFDLGLAAASLGPFLAPLAATPATPPLLTPLGLRLLSKR